MSKTKKEIAQILSKGPRIDLSNDFSRASGVALLLCGEGSSLELLFIKRAVNPADRWSGQIAFPGGKREEADTSLLSACMREVREEIGVELTEECLIGSLDDIQARKRGVLLEFFIEPFVFHLSEKSVLALSPREVEKTYWVSLDYLADKANATTFEFVHENAKVNLPGIRFPDGEVLWGLTYMMLQNFFVKLGQS
jgi:8-oxo-dGTP pyrophosphatase MutT (NUDIX family)